MNIWQIIAIVAGGGFVAGCWVTAIIGGLSSADQRVERIAQETARDRIIEEGLDGD